MASFNGVPVPPNGQKIEYSNGKYRVPDHPVVPFIEGDGTGPDIWAASRRVFDAAVKHAYGTARKVVWLEVYAGEKAQRVYGEADKRYARASRTIRLPCAAA